MAYIPFPPLGQVAKANSVPVAIASDDDIQAKFGIVTETAPASDTASSGLNGRLQRVAQRLTSLIALVPAAIGQTTAAGSFSVTIASDDGVQSKLGIVTETAPASDTASSGLNGRLQRVAQRLTSLIALVPTSLGTKTSAGSFSVTVASDDAINGAVNETAPASDTASSGLNGRLQRIAQRITSLIALVPSSLGTKTSAGSLSVTMASDDAINGAVTETAPASDTASSGLNGRLQRIAQRITSLIALVPTSLGQKTSAGSFSVVIASDDVVSTRTAPPSTGTASNVASAAADTSLLASNSNRKAAIIFNESTSVLYLLIASGTASNTVYSVQIPTNSGYSLDYGQGGVYTGAIRGFWQTANGFARITEYT